MTERKIFNTFTDCLAFIISAVFSPYVTAMVFVVAIIFNYSENLGQFLPWMITFLVFGLLIPGLYCLWLIETGQITDYHISKLAERRKPFIAAGLSALVGTIILIYMGAARPVVVMAVVYTVNTMVVALISQVWKISIHTALFSAIVTVAIILFGPVWGWCYLILIPLSWSRIHRKRHTILQAVAGAMLAFILTTVVFWLFGYF